MPVILSSGRKNSPLSNARLLGAVERGDAAVLRLPTAKSRVSPTHVAIAPGPSSAKAVSGQGYGYPVKPFDREHLVRANFGDPRVQFHGPPTTDTLMHGNGTFSFHQGVDISAPGGPAVYPVVDGTVTFVSSDWIRVTSGDGRAFEYWHIRPLVRNGQHVTARHTLLGHV